jgi:hypothetical protein
MKGNKEEHIIYFWLGHTSSKDEIGTSTRLSLPSVCLVLISLSLLTSYFIITLSYLPLIFLSPSSSPQALPLSWPRRWTGNSEGDQSR